MHHPLQVKLIRFYFALVSPLLPSLAVYSAHKLFHSPVNSKRKNQNEKEVQPPEKFFVYLDEETRLQAFRWGQKHNPIVLLIHGWSTTTRSMTNFLDLLIKHNYQVISYDALRHGKSGGKFSDLAGWADSVHAIMENIGEVECIVAHSFGTAAVTVASKLGLKTKKLAFIAPIADMSAVAHKVGKHLGIPMEIIDKMHAHTWKHNEKSFTKYAKDWETLLHSNFHIPTLIIHDKEDREIGIEHSELLCQRWPWAKLISTEGLGHRKILDDDTVATSVLTFIQEKN
jgi:pimeloyl-ACP methyl ester carboxylesterase